MRALNRVKARITRLNRYYNLPTELWARAFEFYANDKKLLEDKAPKIFNAIENWKLRIENYGNTSCLIL